MELSCPLLEKLLPNVIEQTLRYIELYLEFV